MTTLIIILLIFIIPALYIWTDYYKKRNKEFDFKSIKYIIINIFKNIKSKKYSNSSNTNSDVFTSEAKYYTSRQQQHLQDYDEIEIIKNVINETKNDFFVNINMGKIKKTKNGWIYSFSTERKIYVEGNKFSLFDMYGINISMYISPEKIDTLNDFFDTIYKIAKNRQL